LCLALHLKNLVRLERLNYSNLVDQLSLLLSYKKICPYHYIWYMMFAMFCISVWYVYIWLLCSSTKKQFYYSQSSFLGYNISFVHYRMFNLLCNLWIWFVWSLYFIKSDNFISIYKTCASLIGLCLKLVIIYVRDIE